MIVCLYLHFCYICCMMFCDIFVASALIVLFDCKIKCFDYCVFMCQKLDFPTTSSVPFGLSLASSLN
jgi:hypothetical protein